jgi:GTP-binding protein
VQEYVERASVVRALRALEDAEVGLLLIDAVEGMTEQDARISGYAWERGRALGLLVNKWDAVGSGERDSARVAGWIDERFPSFRVVPKLFLSALTGEGVDGVWPLVDSLAAAHGLRVQTSVLNQVIGDAIKQQAPPMVKGKRPRFFYATQVATSPPTFAFFTSAPGHVRTGYRKYLENRLREAFSLEGAPVRLSFRERRREKRAKR